jgi:hypothetical protein
MADSDDELDEVENRILLKNNTGIAFSLHCKN